MGPLVIAVLIIAALFSMANEPVDAPLVYRTAQ
jgi:hypothetical protein